MIRGREILGQIRNRVDESRPGELSRNSSCNNIGTLPSNRNVSSPKVSPTPDRRTGF
jgi:hypothetical protein